MATGKKGFDWGGLFVALGAGATITAAVATVATALQLREPQVEIILCLQCEREIGRATRATPVGTAYRCDACNLDYESV